MFLNSCFVEFIVYFIKSSLLQASFGGKLRFVLTASAPISPAVLSFLRAVMGCFIFEGYGQTECTAGCTFSMPGDWSTGYTASHSLTAAANIVLIELAYVSFFFFFLFSGHVGAPLPCSMVKLVDIPDMKYYAKDGKGEVS